MNIVTEIIYLKLSNKFSRASLSSAVLQKVRVEIFQISARVLPHQHTNKTLLNFTRQNRNQMWAACHSPHNSQIN